MQLISNTDPAVLSKQPLVSDLQHGDPIERQLQRYARRFRRRLRLFADISNRHADILTSCPAIAVSIATRRRSKAICDEAIQLIIEGRRINVIAQLLGLPRWMLKLPPAAFRQLLPEKLPGMDTTGDFARHIGNCSPNRLHRYGRWLEWILAAHHACDEEFAIWVASSYLPMGRTIALKHIALLGAFAWFSKHPDRGAGLYIDRAWSANMSPVRAIDQAKAWLKRLLLDLCIDHLERNGHWARTRRVHGIDFVPLLTAQDLTTEACVMRNCIGKYGDAVLFGRCHLYSLQLDGARLANLEVKPAGHRADNARIGQFKGPRNKHPTIETQLAAAAWLASQTYDDHTWFEPGRALPPPLRAVAWQHLWAAYIEAKGACGILQPTPRPHDVMGVYAAYSSAGRRAR